MRTPIVVLDELDPTQTDAVRALVARAAAADGAAPLNEEAQLLLGRPGGRHWLLESGGALAGYAQWQPDNGTGQLVVDPDRRRQGHGTALLDAVRAEVGAASVWAFRTLPAAQGFAAARGLADIRGLLVMAKPLDGVQAPAAPPGVTLRGFTDADAAAFLAVNAAAFASHPEQGHFSASDLANRQSEPWWDPAGLILAEDESGVIGFHWTKRHDDATGEVYVLGVHPRAAGRGLGGVLLAAGLAYLAERGASRVILYVDAANVPAVRLYEKGGFGIDHRDTLYGELDAPSGGGPAAARG